MNPIYPNTSALYIQGLIGTDLALCTVHLGKSNLPLDRSTVKADLTAQEADFGGYADIPVTAPLAPYLDPEGGASQQLGTIQFDCDGTAPSNSIYNWWVETAGGELVICGAFDAPISMSVVGDSIPMNIIFSFGR